MLAGNFMTDFYNITYNETAGCSMRYRQASYDFNEGGMSFTSPGQPLSGIMSSPPGHTEGLKLLVNPDFIRQYPLDAKMKNYGFFSYSVSESLHLLDKEKHIIKTIASIILIDQEEEKPWECGLEKMKAAAFGWVF